MWVQFLVEEESMKVALDILLPKIVGEDKIGTSLRCDVRFFQGKKDLLQKLPSILKAYQNWLKSIQGVECRCVVVLDEDRSDCKVQKQELEQIARVANLITKSAAGGNNQYQVMNRIVVEELEAWFFGDVEALAAAYPRIPANLAAKKGYRNPDAIRGGTWEALERVLQKAGYHKAGLSKVKAAIDITPYMLPERNRSRSFQVFREGLLELVQRLVA